MNIPKLKLPKATKLVRPWFWAWVVTTAFIFGFSVFGALYLLLLPNETRVEWPWWFTWLILMPSAAYTLAYPLHENLSRGS